MSFTVSKSLPFPQKTVNFICSNEQNTGDENGHFTIGGILSDTRHVWQAKGPYLEIRDTKRGSKVGSWTFGCILRDSNTKIVDVKELQKTSGKLALLAVALDCTISGGIICLFNIFSSKVVRAIQIKQKVSSLSVVDSGVEVLNLPGPLRDFDGILAVGTEGGNVLLIDLCRQICEESLMSFTIRDELLPSQLSILTPDDISTIDYYRERAVRKGNHLAIHLNVVLDSNTEHFTLKGPKGENRLHVNRQEVCTSALYYCNQLTSLLVGFNFGAFQLWDLTSLKLIYTSPVCDEHIPVTHFALQEPTDDPRAFCYIWVSYSNIELYQNGLPFAVMYAICYESKEYHEGYGYLYQNFQYCAVRFQVELGSLEDSMRDSRSDKFTKGGVCLRLQAATKLPASKDSTAHLSTGDTLALCVIAWTTWYDKNKTQSCALIFDLNQWYKEQMPTFSKWANCNNYILRMNLTDLIAPLKQKTSPLLDIKMDETSLRQFVGVQRLEEHFCPTSLTFDIWALRENEVFSIHSEGLQKALLYQIQNEGPLCLLRPTEIFQRIVALGLTPLFSDISLNLHVSGDVQRETILNVALEHHMLNWLCKCASEWANGRFSSAGCTIDFLLKWAFQRAINLKTSCDKFCAPLFDYSQSRLDNNTSILLNSCTGQINVLYKFYLYINNNLSQFISYMDLAEEQKNSLEMVATYFEVLQWLVNVGLLPECHPSKYPRPDNSERISAPYPVKQLIEYYNEKRANLQLLSKEQFASSDSLLFIDNLINHKCGAEHLQSQWQEDGGSGLYPPPSLQSLLRTYLIPNASICHKHSLVIYLFLDLAMALDQRKYSPVITYLIKFPAVFKVTPSIIKITQAFWQLDHGDHNTAIEQLLDPFVLKEDLQPWHHNIAMRSLLLQNQHKAALRYMQIRRPPMSDEASILTAISLYITNNMVTEAFYFMKEHCQTNQDKFLMHLFNECNKNKSLHVLLYKCLNGGEERAFLNYLDNIEQPNSKDLEVFYYLLRSRFLEAFDAHSKIRKRDPDTKGLIGQRNATHTDQIVRIFKNCLPDVNRNLVEYIRKEKNNLWKEVSRPTPLSVFVHDAQEKIHYKSTVIHAAISKAKNTFQETANSTRLNALLTEDTPFLRTPTAFRTSKRHNTPIITPKVIQLDEDGEEMGPSPPKRRKLSPRVSTVSPNYSLSESLIHSKMLTPIVKRKTSLEHRQTPDDKYRQNVGTPQSILKVRNLVRNRESLEDNTMDEEQFDFRARLSSPSRSYSILPRRSLSKTRQHVQFDVAARFSSSFSDQSISSKQLNDTTLDEKIFSKDTSVVTSSKNSTNTTEEFYSPNASVDDKNASTAEEKIVHHKDLADKLEKEKQVILEKVTKEVETQELKEKINKVETENNDIEQKITQSPRARRSYKRSLGEMSPVRSSPRLSRNISKLVTKSESAIDETRNQTDDVKMKSLQSSKSETDIESDTSLYDTKNQLEDPAENSSLHADSQTVPKAEESPSLQSPRSPRLLQRVKGRKSLTRKVLEHNSMLRLQNSPLIKERIFSKTEKTSITEKSAEASKTTTVESVISITDTESSDIGSPYSERSRQSFGSVSKRKSSLYSPGFYNTSGSDYSINHEEDPALSDLKLSDSMVEFVTSIKNKSDTSKINDADLKPDKSRNVTQDEDDETEDTIRDKLGTVNESSSSILETISSNINSPIVADKKNSFSNRRSSRFSTIHDTSGESDLGLNDDQSNPINDSLTLSDSIVEYVSSLKNKKDVSKTVENSEIGVKKYKEKETLSEANKEKLVSVVSAAELSEEDDEPEKIAAELSEEDDEPEKSKSKVYEDLSSGSEDIEEVLQARQNAPPINQSHTPTQLDIRMESQEVISLDSSDDIAEDKEQEQSSAVSSEDEEERFNRGFVAETKEIVSPNSGNDENEVIEIDSSDTEEEKGEKHVTKKSKYVEEERQEVSLFSHLEKSNSSEEDFSLVYKDMDDETHIATQALEAEMNEPTYTFEQANDNVFEDLEKDLRSTQNTTEDSSGKIESENVELERSKRSVENKELKESGISVSFESQKADKVEEMAVIEENVEASAGKSDQQPLNGEVEKTTNEHKNMQVDKQNIREETKVDETHKKIAVKEQTDKEQDTSEEKGSTKQGVSSNKEEERREQITSKQNDTPSKATPRKVTSDSIRRITTRRRSQLSNKTEQPEAVEEVNKKNKKVKIDSSTNTTQFTSEEGKNDAESSTSSKREKSTTTKKDSATNTTIFVEKGQAEGDCKKNRSDDTKELKETLIEDLKSKTETSTSTTEKEESTDKEDNKDKSECQEKSLTSVNQPEVKVYRTRTLKKTKTEDQNTSSSDTTEGETGRQDIVVTAQVHTPVRKKDEEPLIRRITRRRSQLFSQDEKIDSIQEEKKIDNIEKKESSNSIDLQDTNTKPEDINLPGRRTRRTASSNSTERKPIKVRRSSHSGSLKSEEIDCTPSTSKEILEDPKVITLLRRTRSASVDEIKTYSRKRNLRSTSIDEREEDTIKEEDVTASKPKTKTRAHSVSHMPVISEDTKLKTKKRSRAASALATYATSRRLTRRQADIVRAIPTPTDVTAEDDSEVEEQENLDVFDPINLLDKEPFQGDPDPEEQKVYEPSSPSTSSVSSFSKPRRATRSASMTSDVTPERPSSEASPKKQRILARTHVDSPTRRAVQTRSKQLADTGSEKSEQVTPPKRSKKKHDDQDEVESNVSASSHTTRKSRTSSVKSEGSTASATKKTGRKKITSAKQELPKITEEKVSENVSSADTADPKERKDTRKRKKPVS